MCIRDRDGTTVKWTINANENNNYQNKLDEGLLAQDSAADDDKIDKMCIRDRLCSGHVVVKGNRLVQDRPVTGLPQIGGGARNEPERVIVEAAAHVAVALDVYKRQGV